MKKISDIEKNIFELQGIKLEFDTLLKDKEKYFQGVEKYLDKMSPCEILYNFTELDVPDECFYSFYYIPTNKPDNYDEFYGDDNCAIPKEVLILIGSSDGEKAEYICPIFPPIDVKVSNEIMEKILK